MGKNASDAATAPLGSWPWGIAFHNASSTESMRLVCPEPEPISILSLQRTIAFDFTLAQILHANSSSSSSSLDGFLSETHRAELTELVSESFSLHQHTPFDTPEIRYAQWPYPLLEQLMFLFFLNSPNAESSNSGATTILSKVFENLCSYIKGDLTLAAMMLSEMTSAVTFFGPNKGGLKIRRRSNYHG